MSAALPLSCPEPATRPLTLVPPLFELPEGWPSWFTGRVVRAAVYAWSSRRLAAQAAEAEARGDCFMAAVLGEARALREAFGDDTARLVRLYVTP